MEDNEIIEAEETTEEETAEPAEVIEEAQPEAAPEIEAAAAVTAEDIESIAKQLREEMAVQLDAFRAELDAVKSSMAVFVENGATIIDPTPAPVAPVEAEPSGEWEYKPLSDLDYRI